MRCSHPYIHQGALNNLSPIYCQMVVYFTVYLCKHLKLLMVNFGVTFTFDLTFMCNNLHHFKGAKMFND